MLQHSACRCSAKLVGFTVEVAILLVGTLFGQNVVVNPTSSQNIVQPAGTQTSTNNLGNIRYVTANYNWSTTPTSPSSISAGSNLITLTCTTTVPCPLGIDVSANANHPYAVYISGTGTPEAAIITGAGTCIPGATTGTCTFTITAAGSHGSGYVIGSASTGIQEAINDAAGISGNGSTVQSYASVQLLPASSSTPNYTVYSPVFIRSNYTRISGYGSILACYTRIGLPV